MIPDAITDFEKDKLNPVSKDLRIVEDDSYSSSHPFDLEAKIGDEWHTVRVWNNGHDDWGQLNDPCWQRLGAQCAWTEDGLERYARRLLQHLGYRTSKRKVLAEFIGEDT